MLIRESIFWTEWELQREIERELLLDPERAWKRLEHDQWSFDPLIHAVFWPIRFIVARIRPVTPSQSTSVDREAALETA